VPDQVKKHIYDFVEKTGNLRLERAAFGIVDNANQKDIQVFIRFTGR
jgi:hypothetical protein